MYPFFDFAEPAYILDLDYAAPDLEVLDDNSDERPDIYVVQTDEENGNYCGPGDGSMWWGPYAWSPANWTPRCRTRCIAGMDRPFQSASYRNGALISRIWVVGATV